MKKTIVILGAGITGLAAAYYLSKEFKVIVLEKDNSAGGLAKGFRHKDFILDLGPHKIYTELPDILDEMKKISPLLRIKKKNSIYLKNNYYDFPLKLSQIAKNMPLTALQAGLDVVTKSFKQKPDNSYENFLINRFGKTLYELSFKDYAYKVWNSDPKDLDRELAKRRVAISNVFELVKSVLFKKNKNISAEYFHYPEKGMDQFLNSLTKKIILNKGKIMKNADITKIKIKNNMLEYVEYNKKRIRADYVISTIPLNILNDLTETDRVVEKTTSKITYQSLFILYVILKKPRALDDCWIFFPEKKFIFQRISEQKAFSPLTSPKDKTCLMIETTKNLNLQTIQQIFAQAESAKLFKKNEIEEYFIKFVPQAYPIYKKGFLPELKKTEDFFESIDNFYLLGRSGLFNYNNMDQCWDMAMKIYEQIKEKKSKAGWKKTKNYFENYKIVD